VLAFAQVGEGGEVHVTPLQGSPLQALPEQPLVQVSSVGA
jgi:hypothetical protein